MRNSLLIAIFAAAVTSAYAGDTSGGVFDPQRQIGVAEFNEKGEGCLTIRNGGLRQHEPIDLVFLQEPQTFFRTNIIDKLGKSCSRNSAVPKDASFYSFVIGKEKAEAVSPPAVAVTGYAGSFTVAAGKVRADLNNDGTLESFRACTTTEGLHLTVWAGEPLKSKRLWHEYYYLGYDVEPDCTGKDTSNGEETP